MKPEMVDQCLANYREYSARCTFLEHEIHELRLLADRMRNNAIAESVHITSVMTGMPHGTEISDPTGRLAIEFADGYTPEHVVQVEKEIKRLDAEYHLKITTVIFVDAWLKALNRRERYIIENKTIGGMFWRELIAGYNKEFGELYSKETMKRIRNAALEHIYKVAE